MPGGVLTDRFLLGKHGIAGVCLSRLSGTQAIRQTVSSKTAKKEIDGEKSEV